MATDLPGILIVDDNEDNRYTLQLMLETDGHERIASAAGGNEAMIASLASRWRRKRITKSFQIG